MKIKSPKNPWIFKKLKNSKQRIINLGDIPFVERPDKTKGCIWCGDSLKSKHHATRYCKDYINCSKSAFLWCHPQSRESMLYLLELQNFKCMNCYYSFKDFLISINKLKNNEELSFNLFEKIKKFIPKNKSPEVDHIIAIVKGGQSLGLDNHQVLCYECHKNKTKLDVSKI